MTQTVKPAPQAEMNLQAQLFEIVSNAVTALWPIVDRKDGTLSESTLVRSDEPHIDIFDDPRDVVIALRNARDLIDMADVKLRTFYWPIRRPALPRNLPPV